MKKSELRKIIREQIKNLHEQTSPPGGYFCMNDYEASGPGYCVSQMPLAPDGMTIQPGGTGGQDVYEAMQNAGMGVWAIYPTLEACFAAGICSEDYMHSVYPPPTGGPGGPIGPGGIKGPEGNLYTNYAGKPKKALAPSRKKMMREAEECNPDLNLGAGGANAGCPNTGGPGIYGTCQKKQYSWDNECVPITMTGPGSTGGGTITSRPDRGTPITKPAGPIRGKGKFKLRR